MTSMQAMILGIVQGITEFLPISSSGHLVLLQKLWGITQNNLWFITWLHLGTLVAVCWALREDIRRLARHPFSWTMRMIVVALVPTAFFGALFEELFDHLFQSGITLAPEFIITGCVLWWMDGVQAGRKQEADIRAGDALWIGTLQGFALLPALSRSGLTIAAGLWRGLDRATATRFSFLLSVPAILGATLVELDDAMEHTSVLRLSAQTWTLTAIGFVAAAVAGYFAVYGTLWLMRSARMRIFALYVWCLAAFVLTDQLVYHRWF